MSAAEPLAIAGKVLEPSYRLGEDGRFDMEEAIEAIDHLAFLAGSAVRDLTKLLPTPDGKAALWCLDEIGRHARAMGQQLGGLSPENV